MKDIISEIESNKFLKILLESIGDGIFVLDTNGIIVSWNSSMERITGYIEEEVKGHSCKFLRFNHCFGKDCPSGILDCGIFRYGKVDPTECRLYHKLGHVVHVSKNARTIKQSDGKVIGVVEAVTDLTELHNIRMKMLEAERHLSRISRLEGIIAKSQVMRNVFSLIKASAASDATILIQGESGTGKEMVAKAIHAISDRKDRSMITVNCSALSESLLESELFGHVKGAFTGAVKDRKGRFEEADGGTLFLDEIGEITPYIQVKLLRVLQQREVERVGESHTRKVNIRVITATNKDLKILEQEGRFREDLYYRLKVFPIFLPPLRERPEDIPLLVNHFIETNNSITENQVKGLRRKAMELMLQYNWPGNVRELSNAIEHAFVLCTEREIDLTDLPADLRDRANWTSHSEPMPQPSDEPQKQRQVLSRNELVRLLTDCDWNKAEVARRTGHSRASIWKYMKKWNIPLQQQDAYN